MLIHPKQDLTRESKILGLMNNKKNINIETVLEIIMKLSLLPSEYNWEIKYMKTKFDIISKQYPIYSNMINWNLFDNKIKFFENNSYNYDIFPKDIRSNSILERYNKTIKIELGKRTCNCVVFLNFINRELERINNILSKNQIINVFLY